MIRFPANRSACIIVIALAVALSGCATKRYGRAPSLSVVESAAYTCREIDIEKAKAKALMSDIDAGRKIDWRSVAGWLGDFGLGNLAEEHAAYKSATDRWTALQRLSGEKGCPDTDLPSH